MIICRHLAKNCKVKIIDTLTKEGNGSKAIHKMVAVYGTDTSSYLRSTPVPKNFNGVESSPLKGELRKCASSCGTGPQRSTNKDLHDHYMFVSEAIV